MSSKDLDNLETAPLDIKPESTDLQNSTSDAVIEEVETKPRRSRRITAKVEKDVKSEPSEVKTSTKRKKAAVAETQPSEPLGEGVLLKPLLIQEKVRDDLWKMLVATCLLNVTTGKAARPIFWQILERWPTCEKLGTADKAELEGMITNLGLGDVRSSRLILFSRQYAESAFNQRTEPVDGQTAPFPWSPILAPTKSPKKSLPTKDMTGLSRESVYPFAGVGQYAMDSFAIYSPLLPGGGAPRDEAYWLEPDVEGGEVEEVGSGSLLPRKVGTRDVSDRDDSGDEWRKVMPNDKELVRYLTYRWAIEGIEWDPKRGPIIRKEEDAKRLGLPKVGQEMPDAEPVQVEAVTTMKHGDTKNEELDEEEAAMNDSTQVPAVPVVEIDWRLSLPAFLRYGLDLDQPEENQPEASTSAVNESGEAEDPDAPPKMSKNAAKKAARMAKADAAKGARRAAEKLRAKEKKYAQQAEFNEGKMTAEEAAEYEIKKKEKAAKMRLRQKGEKVKDEDTWQGGIVIDLAFDHLMVEPEIKSMTGQLGYCHSANRLTKMPFRRVVYSGLCGKVKHRLQTVLQNQYIVWPRSDWRDADVGDLALGNDLTAPALGKEPNPFPGQTYVYLTADSEYELETLREDETYVIGGIVDKNRYKNLCKDKAEKLGMKTARLPIGTFIAEMPTRKVLTVNQVFEIMVKYIELKDWRAAFEVVIPKRKFKTEGKIMARRGHKRAWEERGSVGSGSPVGEKRRLTEGGVEEEGELVEDEGDDDDPVEMAVDEEEDDEETMLNAGM